jgi:hypothetical protein
VTDVGIPDADLARRREVLAGEVLEPARLPAMPASWTAGTLTAPPHVVHHVSTG